MSVDYLIYEDGVIAIKLFAENADKEKSGLFHLAICYLKPQDTIYKNGEIGKVTNIMNGETDWFILPTSFGYAIGKRLIEQKVAGLDCFDENGFKRMVDWLIDMEEINDAMEY